MAATERLRRRFWLEMGLALLSGLIIVATGLDPEWIEDVFGIDPDARSGLLELSLVIAAVIGLVGLLLARSEWRRAHVAQA